MDFSKPGNNPRPPRNRNSRVNLDQSFQGNSQNFPFDPSHYTPPPNLQMLAQNMGNNPYFHPFSSNSQNFSASQQLPPQFSFFPPNTPQSYQHVGVEGSGSHHQIEDDDDAEVEVDIDNDVGATYPQHSSQPAFSQPAFSPPAFSQPAFSPPVFSQPAFSPPTFSQPAFSPPVISESSLLQNKKVWGVAEDEALVSAYMNTSCDPIVGTNQKIAQFWRKVMASYEEAREYNPNGISARNMDSLKGRWRRISTSVIKWVGCYDKAVERKRSGMNDDDVLREAHRLFEDENKTKFLFQNAWVMLRRYFFFSFWFP